MTIMQKNAAEYGLETVTPDPPEEYDTIEVSAATQLALVADLTDTPASELTELNPALVKGIAPAGYSLRVPKGMGASLQASLEMIPADKRASWRMHKVMEGETLAMIGKRYGASPALLASANKLSAGVPVVGEMLMIPALSRPVISSAARRTSTAHRTTVASRQTSARPGAQNARRPAAWTAHPTAAHGNTIRRKPLKVVTHTAQNLQ